jgi:hypothetical protein
MLPACRRKIDIVEVNGTVRDDAQRLAPRRQRAVEPPHDSRHHAVDDARTGRPSISETNGRRRFERELIEMQQDRLDASTRVVYDRDDRPPERVELMQFWADKIDALRDDQSSVQLTMTDRRA